MARFKIIETNEIIDLSIYDKNGVDWSVDFIGNYDDFCTSLDNGERLITQSVADFYTKLFLEYQEAQEALDALRLTLDDTTALDEHLHLAMSVDLEYQPMAIRAAVSIFSEEN